MNFIQANRNKTNSKNQKKKTKKNLQNLIMTKSKIVFRDLKNENNLSANLHSINKNTYAYICKLTRKVGRFTT